MIAEPSATEPRRGRGWLDRLPRPLVELLRGMRTAALWLLEPLDWVHRRVTSSATQGPVPPMWLRRHSGPIWAFERASAEIATTIAVLGLVRADDHVLDIGCGCGSMALEFQRMLGPSGSYVGFDVHGPSIRWCRRRFGTEPRFRFELADLRTAWSNGAARVTQYRFPMPDASADFVLAKSVFTHMLEEECRHYLREIRRVLKPGRAALITAFLLSDETPDPATGRGPRLAFPCGGSHIRWRVRSRPESILAYEEKYFLHLLEGQGLRADRVIAGSWSGREPSPNWQDIIVATPRPRGGVQTH